MEMANQNGVVQVPNLPANGLQKFVITRKHICYRNPGNVDERGKQEEGEEEGAIELTLGLSSNGRFVTDPGSKKRKNRELARSSSIAEGETPRVSDTFQVSRTLSLPVEERRRKESQSRRRKRSEKTRAYHGMDGGDGGEWPSLDLNDYHAHAPSRGIKGNVQSSGDGEGREKKEERERARKILEKMPSVTTREVGPDGKRVDEVRIVCLCHAFLLSPADFLNHGGASASAVLLNPLRHILVTPPSSL